MRHRKLSIIPSVIIGAFDVLDAQRGRLFLWLPVLYGFGVAVFFAQNLEPSSQILWGCFVAILGAVLILRFLPDFFSPPLVALAAVLCGFLGAGIRAEIVAEPVVNFRYYGPVEGRVVKIDRSASEALRLTLDHVVLRDFSPERTPYRVRISLHGEQNYVTPEPGMQLAMTAHLSPPPGPTEPGGFDFQRMAWFDRLGAVGYTRVPVLRAGEPDKGPLIFIHRLRQSLSNTLQNAMDGQAGAFAAAILTGDRSAITQDTAENLRGANLSHLLAISGLHMGLLTGAIFYVVRLGLALIPGAALRLPLKKIAAFSALGAGAFYLALSGWNVATERAYVMVAMMFVAILLDRQAVTLRAVAIAAMIILILRPEVLPEPGFQMSFAATTALVFVFTLLRQLQWMATWKTWQRGIATVIISSAVAGIATAPVAAAHFNRVADFGLIANVISVPVMGAVVMPMAILAVILAPIGLSSIAFSIMEVAINWILTVAATVSSWDGAVTYLPAPHAATLPLIALGGLFVILWRGRAQNWGIIPLFLGFLLWGLAERPALLVADDGSLVGRMSTKGRVLSKSKGSGFAASSWLENDGDAVDQFDAGMRNKVALDVGGVSIAHVTGRGWKDRLEMACDTHDVVIVNQFWDGDPLTDCLLIDQSFLRQSGSLGFSVSTYGTQMRSSYGVSGVRYWNTPKLRGPYAISPFVARLQRRDEELGVEVAPFNGGD